jgi:hypothetical protein
MLERPQAATQLDAARTLFRADHRSGKTLITGREQPRRKPHPGPGDKDCFRDRNPPHHQTTRQLKPLDIVYASFERDPTAPPAGPGEASEVLDVLWAHAHAEDLLEHARARPGPHRLDLLLFLRPRSAPGPVHRAAALLRRSHGASPLLQRRYLRPTPANDRVDRAL